MEDICCHDNSNWSWQPSHENIGISGFNATPNDDNDDNDDEKKRMSKSVASHLLFSITIMMMMLMVMTILTMMMKKNRMSELECRTSFAYCKVFDYDDDA